MKGVVSSQTRQVERDTLLDELSAKVAKLEQQVEQLLELVPHPCELCHEPTPACQLRTFGGWSIDVCPTCFDRMVD